MDLTNEDVADILALLDSLPYDELDLQTSRFRLTLRREPGGWTQARQVSGEPDLLPAPQPPPGSAPAASAATDGAAESQPGPDGGRLVAVTAPLPGTFYRAPRPGAAPFTEAGAAVGPDSVVAIVETMKLMNPVHAGVAGRVAQVCAANGEPVTQGAVLMRIDPEPAR